MKSQSFAPGKTSYRGPIYVLIDATCGSSCESTLEALQMHPNVKTVGENTRGMIHFTNEGMIQLPESHLFVRMATKFNDYDQFIEKVGHTPDVRVPKGQDAFDYLVQHYFPLREPFETTTGASDRQPEPTRAREAGKGIYFPGSRSREPIRTGSIISRPWALATAGLQLRGVSSTRSALASEKGLRYVLDELEASDATI